MVVRAVKEKAVVAVKNAKPENVAVLNDSRPRHDMNDQQNLFHYIGVQAKLIKELGPKVHRKLGEEDVHKLWVATRRARAAFWVIKHSSVPTRFDKLESLLKALGKDLGNVRELDVAFRDADHFKMKCSSLGGQRKSALKRLKKITVQSAIDRIGKQFEAAEKSLMEAGPILLGRPNEVLKVKLEDCAKGSAHGKKARHKLRTALRKVRYSLEAIGRPVAPLNHIIKALGDAHDLERLQAFLHKKGKVRTEQKALNAQVKHLSLPALHYAVKQLEKDPH